ncbi:MAG TPA: asparaginase [Ilumatobacter sp.]|nr:asparaginase [Ilumatobacter sp.]
MTGVDAGAFVPLAVTTRSGFRESVHAGAAVGLAADGSVAVAFGDPYVTIFPRSSNKPLQAEAMLALGWRATDEQLALACASHAGTPRHLAVVESTLAAAGLTATDLGNTPSLPLDSAATEAVLRGGGAASPLLQNCSGKHAAMLATCVVNGWDRADYLATEHPLQRAITERFASQTGQPGADAVFVGIDGCGAPTHATPLVGLAASYARLATAHAATWRAMTAWPDLVDGDGRTVTRLMQAVPGLMAKAGAEGVFAAALPDGRTAAVKIADGTSRAVGLVIAEVLRRLGVDVDPAAFAEPVLGHGVPVGTTDLLV